MEGEGNGEAEGRGEGVISENSEDKLRGRWLAWEGNAMQEEVGTDLGQVTGECCR